MAKTSLRDRLADSNEIFTADEVKQAFSELADIYGYYKLPQNPIAGNGHYTENFSLNGYEHLGVFSIRPMNQRDEMINIPCIIDEILKDRPNAGNSAYGNAYILALAKTVIVAPEGLVDAVLDSDDPRDAGFFRAFSLQYRQWQDDRAKAARKKKSGTAPKELGSESATTSESAETSSPPVTTG